MEWANAGNETDVDFQSGLNVQAKDWAKTKETLEEEVVKLHNPWRLVEEEGIVFLEVWCVFKEMKLLEFCQEEMGEEMNPPSRVNLALYTSLHGA
jgi:hypothetical protein